MSEPDGYWEQRYQLQAGLWEPPTAFGQQAAEWVQALQERLGRPLEVLELGAGQGRDARALVAAGAAVVALDGSATGLKELAGVAGVRTVVADLRHALPFVDAAFDAVYSHFVLSCAFRAEEVARIVTEIDRVLRPEGELWLAVRSTDDPIYLKGPQAGPGYYPLGESGLHFFSRRHLRQLLEPFRVVQLIALQRQQNGELYGVLETRSCKTPRTHK